MNDGKIWLENLAYSDEILSREERRRQTYVCSLARPFAEAVARLVEDGLTLTDAVLAEAAPAFEESRFSDKDRSDFVKEVSKRLTEAGISDPLGFAFLDMSEPFEHAERISLVRNRYSDLAFDLFAKQFASPRVVASHSFRDACEEVSGGYSDYCILPVFDENDGRLRVPFALMQQYELRICDTVNVPSFDDGGMTQYALLARGIVEKRYEEPVFLLRVESDAPKQLVSILTALSEFGLECSDLWSEKGEYGFVSLLTVAPRDGDMSALFLYLLLFYDGFQPLGYFEQKRENEE